MMFFNVSKKICLRDAVFAFLLLNLYSHYRSVDLWLDVRKDSVRGRCHVRFSYLNLYSHYRSIWTCGLRMVGVGVRVAQDIIREVPFGGGGMGFGLSPKIIVKLMNV